MRTDLCEPTFRQLTLLATLLVGAVLLWLLPLGGALLMVVASFGLVIGWEPDLSDAVMAPASGTDHSGDTPGPGARALTPVSIRQSGGATPRHGRNVQ